MRNYIARYRKILLIAGAGFGLVAAGFLVWLGLVYFGLVRVDVGLAESLTGRRPQDVTQRFLAYAAAHNQTGLQALVVSVVAPEGNESWRNLAIRRTGVVQELSAKGIVSSTVESVKWASHCCQPRTVEPNEANDALVTAKVTYKSGETGLVYVKLWDDTPEFDQAGLGGLQFTRNWKVLEVMTEEPRYYP